MPAVNDVGEPCAGEPHARFDGRELETEYTWSRDASGTTSRETAGMKACSPTASTRHRASSRPYKLIMVVVVLMPVWWWSTRDDRVLWRRMVECGRVGG